MTLPEINEQRNWMSTWNWSRSWVISMSNKLDTTHVSHDQDPDAIVNAMCSAPLTNGLCHRADRCQGFPNRLSNWNPRARSKWWRKQWADKSANKLPLRGQNAKDYVGSRNYLKHRIWVRNQSQILGIYYLMISNSRKRKAPQLCLPTKMEKTQLLLLLLFMI